MRSWSNWLGDPVRKRHAAITATAGGHSSALDRQRLLPPRHALKRLSWWTRLRTNRRVQPVHQIHYVGAWHAFRGRGDFGVLRNQLLRERDGGRLSRQQGSVHLRCILCVAAENLDESIDVLAPVQVRLEVVEMKDVPQLKALV